MADKLRLRAADAEDLAVIAACVQDARMLVEGDGRTRPRSGGSWRRSPATGASACADWTSCEGLTECLAALVFEEIDEVKYRGLDSGAARPGSWRC